MTNPDNVGGLLPCPFCGGEPIQYDYADGYGIHCGNVECTIDMFATSRDSDADARAIWNRRNGELCRAAPAGGVYAHPGEIEAARRNLERGIGDGLVTVSVKPVPGYVALNSAPAGSGGVGAWMHEDDPSRVVSAVQKESNLRDGGASASSMRPYSIPLLRKLQQGADASVPRECQSRFRCDCLGACKYGLAGGGAASQGQEGGK